MLNNVWIYKIDPVNEDTAQTIFTLNHKIKITHAIFVHNMLRPPVHQLVYRVSQEECARFREGVPYVKVYRYNPKHPDVIPIRCALSVLVYSRLKRVPRCDCTCKVLGNPKDNYVMSVSVFVVQFNGFMSLTSYFDVKYRY